MTIIFGIALGITLGWLLPLAAITEWRNTRPTPTPITRTASRLQPVVPLRAWTDPTVPVPGLVTGARTMSGLYWGCKIRKRYTHGVLAAHLHEVRYGPLAWCWTDTGPRARPAAGPWALHLATDAYLTRAG